MPEIKPQLVGIDVGMHHKNPKATSERLMKTGQWKKQRVVMLIPAAETIPAKVYLSHCGLIFPPNQPCYKMMAIGMEVGEAYSNAIEQILATPGLNEFEFLLTIEHDNIPESPDALIQLIQSMEDHPEYACIGGLYFTKGLGGVAQIWGDPKDPLNFRPQPPDPNGGLVPCTGTGMGFNLWRLQMFKDPKLRRPWFKTVADKTGLGTQDLYGWGDFNKHGYRAAVNCSVKVGHYDLQNDITW